MEDLKLVSIQTVRASTLGLFIMREYESEDGTIVRITFTKAKLAAPSGFKTV